MRLDPIKTVESVDLQRFMGAWYVISVIPTFIEKGAYNPVETYSMNSDGSIATTFTFNQDALDGPQKTYHPTGYVRNQSTKAEWAMQFIWPFKSEYLIAYLATDYSVTIIARNARDYVWIMARTPTLAAEELSHLKQLVAAMGYDTNKLVYPSHRP